jgi:magnesium transporter
VIVDCAACEHGLRATGQLDLDHCRSWRDKPGAFVWLGLRMPNEAEARRVADVFDLHPLAAEDAMGVHDLPKIEAFGPTLLVVLRTAHYQKSLRTVSLGEIAVLCGEHFVITVRHGHASPLDQAQALLPGHRRPPRAGQRPGRPHLAAC